MSTQDVEIRGTAWLLLALIFTMMPTCGDMRDLDERLERIEDCMVAISRGVECGASTGEEPQ